MTMPGSGLRTQPPQAEPTRVLIADDHPLFRSAPVQAPFLPLRIRIAAPRTN